MASKIIAFMAPLWSAALSRRFCFSVECGAFPPLCSSVECGAFPPLLFFLLTPTLFAVIRDKNKSGGKAPHSKGQTMDDRRIRLIERLCRSPEAQLAQVEALLDSFDAKPIAHPTFPAACAPAAPHPDWPHAPLHRLSEHGTFIVTGSTHDKAHF